MGAYRGWLCLLTLVFTAASAGAVSPWVETRTYYTNAEGLPDTEVLTVAAKRLARLSGGRWVTVQALAGTCVEYWNHDPFRLNTGGGGDALSDGAAFLLPYYMGLHHGFVKP